MIFNKNIFFIFLFFLSPFISAQEDQAIEELKSKLEQAEYREILSVNGTTRETSEVIRVDTLRFDDDAILELQASDRKAVYIIANEIRLSKPNYRGVIKFFDTKKSVATNGKPPAPAIARLKRSNNDGKDGSDGKRGNQGQPGIKKQLPKLVIATNKITFQRETGQSSGFSDLSILIDGIDGGDGGNGGDGQNGQPGQHGRHGETSWGFCSKGPRSGGNGGNGGDFGKAGIGADGGDGGDVVFIVSPNAEEEIKNIRIRTRGGLPGRGGQNGKPGSGGRHGDRGSRPGTCDGANHGSNGKAGAVAQSDRASDGIKSGNRGAVEYIVTTKLLELLEK